MEGAKGKTNFCPSFGTTNIRRLNEKALVDNFLQQGADAGGKFARTINVFITKVTPPNRQNFVNLGLTDFYSMDTV